MTKKFKLLRKKDKRNVKRIIIAVVAFLILIYYIWFAVNTLYGSK